jgi:hypothetical protein
LFPGVPPWCSSSQLEKETLAFSAAASKINVMPGSSGSAGDSASAKLGNGGGAIQQSKPSSAASSAVKVSLCFCH